VEKRFYIEAADRVRQSLVSLTDKSDGESILRLWHTRVSCLIKARLSQIAKAEAKVIGDLGAEKYRLSDGTSVAPWGLRLLLTPIQAGGENQNTLSRYYALAREARVEIVKAIHRRPDPASGIYVSAAIWKERLRDLGLYIAATLMAMRDMPTAIDHLKSLYYTAAEQRISKEDKKFSHKVASVLGLAHLQVGDTISAREWFQLASSSHGRTLAYAVCSIADADWSEADKVLDEDQESADTANNLAITRLHEGQLSEAVERLEKLVRDGCVESTVLHNLFSLYDLQREVTIDKKLALLADIRQQGVESLGNYDLFRYS
jgi:hypothetical protein